MPQIPYSVLRDLKCGHCGNWLSCGPVFVLPLGNTICGRCRHVAVKKFRHFAYEALAEYFRYPCMYYTKHCHRILKWNESMHHEDYCNYRSVCSKLCSHPSVLLKADKKLIVEDAEIYEYIPDKILEPYLKCSVCECYLSCSPVFVRPNGTSICHRCITANGPPEDGSIRHFSYEKLAEKMLFPCIYRYRGCTQHFRFGRDIWNHETECSYGQIYRKPSKKVQKGQKERGVIETHTGHVYGTLTPNSFQLFAPPPPGKRSSNLPSISHKREQSDDETQFVNELRKKQEKFSNGRHKISDDSNSSSIVSNQENNNMSSLSPGYRPTNENQKTPPMNEFISQNQDANMRFSFNAKNQNALPEIKIPKVNVNGPNQQNNLIRNDSILHQQRNSTRSDGIYDNVENNQLVISELKCRQKLQENENVETKKDSSPPVTTPTFKPVQNLDDIIWVYDDIKNRYKMGK